MIYYLVYFPTTSIIMLSSIPTYTYIILYVFYTMDLIWKPCEKVTQPSALNNVEPFTINKSV